METAEIPDPVRRAIARHASENVGREICGILIGRRDAGRIVVDEALRCENRAPSEEQSRRFVLDPLEVVRAERRLRGGPRDVVGFYHSHPAGEPRPSPEDRTYMAYWPKTLWVIVSPAEGVPHDEAFETPRVRGWTNLRYGDGATIREVRVENA